MITVFTKTDCLMFNLGEIDKEIEFAKIFTYHKENTEKRIDILHPTKGKVRIFPKECTLRLENRRYVENDTEYINNFINQLYK